MLGHTGHNSSSALSPERANGGRRKCAHTRPESVSKQHTDIANYTTASYRWLPPPDPRLKLSFCKDLEVEYLK